MHAPHGTSHAVVRRDELSTHPLMCVGAKLGDVCRNRKGQE